MSAEGIFQISALIHFGLCGLVAAVVFLPLRRILTELCGNRERGDFWTMLALIQLFAIPLFAFLMGFQQQAQQPTLFIVINYIRWSVLGIIVAVTIISIGVMIFWVPRDLPVSRAEVDDLKRLLGAVQTLRAKELLKHRIEEEEQ